MALLACQSSHVWHRHLLDEFDANRGCCIILV